jgi:hypothetical protein
MGVGTEAAAAAGRRGQGAWYRGRFLLSTSAVEQVEQARRRRSIDSFSGFMQK